MVVNKGLLYQNQVDNFNVLYKSNKIFSLYYALTVYFKDYFSPRRQLSIPYIRKINICDL